MADNADNIDYDPEHDEEAPAKYRLPYALCKQRGITPEPWWRPRDAWAALRGVGVRADDEYRKMYSDMERARRKERERQRAKRRRKKAEQLADKAHNPDAVAYRDGAIAGVDRGAPMDFAAADGKRCNPYYRSDYIGYHSNCQTCVAVYFARRMGYDVQALPNLNNAAIRDLSHDVTLAYKTADGGQPNVLHKPWRTSKVGFLEAHVMRPI